MTTYGFSTWQGRIRKDPAWPTDDSPVGAVTGRDYAVNNAMHYADIMAQNRVELSQRGGAYIEAISPVSGGWAIAWVGASFPISLRPDGSSYRCRVRIAGCGESAVDKVRFAFSIGPALGTAAAYALTSPSVATTDNVWDTGDVSSATPAYLTGATLGVEAWTTQIALTAAQAAQCTSVVSTIVDVAGAPVSVTQAIVQPTIWTYTDDSAHPARLYAASLEEWPG